MGVLTGFTKTLSRCNYQDGEPNQVQLMERPLTSSQDFASSRIHPNSITSAESFVTYTPCSSQVVATWMTTYRSRLGACGDGVGWLAILNVEVMTTPLSRKEGCSGCGCFWAARRCRGVTEEGARFNAEGKVE